MILIVEDDKILQTTVTRQLKKLGYESISVGNGKDALDKFKSNEKFALIFMDIHMPIMNGLDATKAMRQFEAEANIEKPTPIIAMTANPNRNQCFEAGMNDFLFKPVLLEQLKEMLDKWVPLQKDKRAS
jgi:CheY-like chemotaxis protein